MLSATLTMILLSAIAVSGVKTSAVHLQKTLHKPQAGGGVSGGVVSPASPAVKSSSSWTLDQRLALRCNPVLARTRAREHERTAPSAAVSTRSSGFGRSVDVISGDSHPELFLPHELFDVVILHGVLDPQGRRFYAAMAKQAGLPDDFANELETLSSDYIKDLREQQKMRSDRSVAGRAMALAHGAALDARICRDRALALRSARAVFGSAVDHFLYDQVAPGITEYLDEYSDERVLRSREGGCQ